jgi:signal transduction histidine kinase
MTGVIEQRTVLVVEDNPGDAALLEAHLEEEDSAQFRLEVAGTLAQGVALANSGVFDVALVDLSLPDARGLQTVDRFLAEAPGCPLIVLTGLDDWQVGRQAVQRGAQDFIFKGDATGPLLARAIGHAVERSELRKRLARALAVAHDNSDNLDQIVSRSVEGIVVADLEGAVRYVNPAAARLLGPDGAERLVAPLTLPAEPGVVTELEVALPGGQRIAEVRCFRTTWDGQDAQLVFLRDVTEQRRAEGEVRALAEDLERRVEARTAALEAARREMESFSYSVSHDLQAPLRTMTGFSVMLLEDYADVLDDEGRDLLQRIDGAAKRMRGLIEALLSLSKVSRRPLAHGKVDIAALAADVVEELKVSDPTHRPTVTLPGPIEVEGDGALLRDALQNLLNNAWKFTRTVADPWVEISRVATEDGLVGFCVRDNGVGFDPRLADRLFAVFQRLHTEAAFKGTGIGLATVQRIAQRHEGRVWAESELGAGASFYFVVGRPAASG